MVNYFPSQIEESKNRTRERHLENPRMGFTVVEAPCTAAWLYDRLTDECVRPPGMGHLEE
jgi:hypothetical protein